MATSYMAMLDGIIYVVNNNKSQDDLLAEISKKSGEEAEYLEKIENIEVKKTYLKLFLMKKEINTLVRLQQQYMKISVLLINIQKRCKC